MTQSPQRQCKNEILDIVQFFRGAALCDSCYLGCACTCHQPSTIIHLDQEPTADERWIRCACNQCGDIPDGSKDKDGSKDEDNRKDKDGSKDKDGTKNENDSKDKDDSKNPGCKHLRAASPRDSFRNIRHAVDRLGLDTALYE